MQRQAEKPFTVNEISEIFGIQWDISAITCVMMMRINFILIETEKIKQWRRVCIYKAMLDRIVFKDAYH